jgi:hypothetical protein
MIVYFIKTKLKDRKEYWTYDWDRFVRDQRLSYFTDRTWSYADFKEGIEAKLNETFSSVKYMKYKHYYDSRAFLFSFEDEADEAFFLIWSNDGIEI